jgi:hypothetical protein
MFDIKSYVQDVFKIIYVKRFLARPFLQMCCYENAVSSVENVAKISISVFFGRLFYVFFKRISFENVSVQTDIDPVQEGGESG